MGKDKRANIAAAKQRQKLEATFRMGVIGAAAIAVIGYILVYFMGIRGQIITLHTDVEGLEPLRVALADGTPLLVQCVSDEVPTHGASIAAARNLASSGVQVATLRCLDNLPSGKNFFQRFGFRDDSLPDKDHPLFFLFANLDPPKRPKGADLRNTTTIVSFAARESTPRVHHIKDEKDFAYHCLRRKACVILLAAGVIDTDSLQYVAEKHRNVRIATINTDDLALSFFEQVGITSPRGIPTKDPKVVVLRSTSTEEEIKQRRDKIAADQAQQRKAKKDGTAAPRSVIPPLLYGVHAYTGGSDASSIDRAVNALVLEGDGKGEGWSVVADPKATLLRTPETAAEKARRERREEARRQHKARREGKPVEEEITTTVDEEDGSSSSSEGEQSHGGSVGDELNLDDEDIIVSDDEE